MYNIDTTSILERTEVEFLNTLNILKGTLLTDMPKIMIIKYGTYNTHSKYLNDLINKSITTSAEIFVSSGSEDTNKLLDKVANGDYLVYFDEPNTTMLSEQTRDDWEYNPDINGLLGSYRLNNIVNGSVVPSKIAAVAKIAAKFRTKANGTLIWGQDSIAGPTTLELLKYNTYHYSKPIVIYGAGHHINGFDLEEKVIIAFESFNSTNLGCLYKNPKALYIDACYRIIPEDYDKSPKFSNYDGRIVTEQMVKNVDRACILYNILNAYKRIAWSRIGTNSRAYEFIDATMKEINKIME